MAPPHPCNRCRRVLVPRGQSRCGPCEARVQRQDVQHRGSSTARGYDSSWRRLRAAYAAQHHWCEDCLANDKRVPTAIVDHVQPHRGDEALRLDWNNLRALCRGCHSRKTAKEGHGYRATPTVWGAG